MSMTEGPDGYAVDAARQIVRDHADGNCPNCRNKRCWMLEWALKTTIQAGEIPPDLEHPVRMAARRVAEVHWPGDDGLCSPCLKPDCEPGGLALTYLNVLNDPWMPPVVLPTPTVATLRRITGME